MLSGPLRSALLALGLVIAPGVLSSTASASDPTVSLRPPPPADEDARQDLLGFGAASRFGVLVLGGRFAMSGGARIEGDHGLVGATSGEVSGGSRIEGVVVREPGARVRFRGGSLATRGTAVGTLEKAVTDAQLASDIFAEQPPTQVFGDLRSSATTIAGNGGHNVIRMGSVRIAEGDRLTLRGGPHDLFVINVHGDFVFSGGSLVLDGISPAQVVWNFPKGRRVELSGSARDPQGTFLNPKGTIRIGSVNLIGAAIARSVVLHSGGKVTCPASRGAAAVPSDC